MNLFLTALSSSKSKAEEHGTLQQFYGAETLTQTKKDYFIWENRVPMTPILFLGHREEQK